MKNINKTIFAALLIGSFAFAPSAFAFDYDRHNRQFEGGSRYSYDGPTYYSYSYSPVYHYDPMPRYDYKKPRYDDYKPRYDHKSKSNHVFTYHGPDDNYDDYHWYDKHDRYDDYGWNKRDRGYYDHY